VEFFTEELSSKCPGSADTDTNWGWSARLRPSLHLSGAVEIERGPAHAEKQTCVGTANWLERKAQGPPLPDPFLRGFMLPKGLNSIGLLLMSMTPHPFFSLRTVRVTRSTRPSSVDLSM
jgi:hypothetical protein